MDAEDLVSIFTVRQGELTTLFRDACRELGEAEVRRLLPAHMEFSMSDHATGCQCWLILRSDGHPDIRAWEGSIWYSSDYKFNDDKKRLGIRPECAFVASAIEGFFTRLGEARAHRAARIAVDNARACAEERSERERALKHFAGLFAPKRGGLEA